MRIYTLIPLVLLVFAGCGGNLPVAPVSGTVTLGSKPLVGATITTQPIATDSRNPGPGSFGRTDDQGHFELELVKPAVKGAIIGEHRVMISPASDPKSGSGPKLSSDGKYEFWTDDPRSNRAAAGSNWPVRFSDGSLTIEVPREGTDKLRFDLTR